MNAVKQAIPRPGQLVEKAEVVSPADSSVVVKRLHLTAAGRKLLSTTSTGIVAGVDLVTRPLPAKRFEPA